METSVRPPAFTSSERTIREVEQFLYREARLLDERRFHEWLQLFTEDVRYWMPLRSNRYPANSKAIKRVDPQRADEEFTGDDDLALLDESMDTLTRRIARLDTGMAWAEDPPSRTRHCITNVEIDEAESSARELRVYSNFVVYRTRQERERELFVGSRRDTLRRVDGALKIASRRIVLDDTVLSVKNISIFF